MPLTAALLPRRFGWLWALLTCCLAGCAAPAPAPTDAVPLTVEALQEGLVPLTSGWQARPGIDGALDAARTPEAWQPVDIRRSFRAQGFPDEGAVSYRLHLRLPSTRTPLRGGVQHANNAHRIWAVLPSGEVRLLAASGQVSDVPAEVQLSRMPVVFTLPRSPEMTLVWQVANAGYPRGGPFYPLYVGLEEHMQQFTLRHIATSIALASFFMALCVVALLSWLQNVAEPPALAIALLSFLMGLRVPLQAGLFEHLLGLSFDARVQLEMMTALALPGATAFLLWAALPWAFAPLPIAWSRLGGRRQTVPALLRLNPHARELPRAYRRANTYVTALALVVSLVTTLLAVASPPALVGLLLLPSTAVFLLFLGVMLLLAVEVVYVRHPLALCFALSFASLACVGVHDLLVATGTLVSRQYLLGYGYAAFFLLFCTAYVTLRLRAARRAEEANAVLRQRVEERSMEVQQASRAAQAAYLAKGQFLAAVSHELRTPLAAMMGYTRLLDEEIGGTLAPEHREFLSTIEESGDRLLGLINDLLDLSRIEAGRFELHPRPVPATDLVREVCHQMRPLALEKGLALDLTSDLDAQATVHADPVRLRQVLLNIVSNAVKFTDAGAVRLHVRAATHEGRGRVVYSVEDTGTGISAAFLPHLFDLFAQEPSAYARTQRGTGLGLPLARELVERMGGTITVESEQGRGSVFTVSLPARPDAEGSPVPARCTSVAAHG